MTVILDLPWTAQSVEIAFDRVPVAGEWIRYEDMYLEVMRVVWDRSRDAGLGGVAGLEPRLILGLVT